MRTGTPQPRWHTHPLSDRRRDLARRQGSSRRAGGVPATAESSNVEPTARGRCRLIPREDGPAPAWWFRDLVIALVIGLLITVSGIAVQRHFDQQREGRERALATQQHLQSLRLANLNFVRERSSDEPRVYRPFNGMDLQGQNLSGLHLVGADMREANLADANLRGAKFAAANLYRANLTDAIADGVDFSGADLNLANLTGAKLSATLTEAGMVQAILIGADLYKAYLPGANMRGAKLSGAHLSDATLTRVVLSYADLTAADLSGAHLRGADLTGANLTLANLNGADLSEATLSGVDLSVICRPWSRPPRLPEGVTLPRTLEPCEQSR